jgi:hypothetical protein
MAHVRWGGEGKVLLCGDLKVERSRKYSICLVRNRRRSYIRHGLLLDWTDELGLEVL